MVLVRLISGWRELHVEVDLSKSSSEVYAALEKALAVDGRVVVRRQYTCGGRAVTEGNVKEIVHPGCKLRVLEDALDAAGAPRTPRTPRSLGPLRPQTIGGRRVFVKVPRREPSKESHKPQELRPWDSLPSKLGIGSGPEAHLVSYPSSIVSHRAAVGAGMDAWSSPRVPNQTVTGKKRDYLGRDPFPLRPLGPRGVKLPTLPGVQGITLPPSALDLDMEELRDYHQDSVTTADLGQWMGSFKDELGAFQSTALYAEMRIHEALRNTQGLRIPNTLRATVVCQGMEELVGQMGAFSRIGRTLWDEMALSIFHQGDEDEDGSSALPFFMKFEQLSHDYAMLHKQTQALNDNLFKSEERGEKRMTYARRTMNNMSKHSLSNGLKMWIQHVRFMKEQRKRLRSIVFRWKHSLVTKSFEGWKLTVQLIREKRMLQRLEELDKINKAVMMRAKKAEIVLPLETKAKDDVLKELEERKRANGSLEEEIRRLQDDLDNSHLVLKLSREDDYRSKCDAFKKSAVRVISVGVKSFEDKLPGLEVEDLSQVMRTGETADGLVKSNKAKLLLRWVNFHAERHDMPPISNLNTDLAGGKLLAMLNHVASPELCGLELLDPARGATPEEICTHVVSSAEHHLHMADSILQDDGADMQLETLQPDMLFIYISYIFEFYPHIKKTRAAAEAARDKVEECHRVCKELEDWDVRSVFPPRFEAERGGADSEGAGAGRASAGSAGDTLSPRSRTPRTPRTPKGGGAVGRGEELGGDGDGEEGEKEVGFEEGNKPPPGGWRLDYGKDLPVKHPLISARDALGVATAAYAKAKADADASQAEFRAAARACGNYGYSMLGARIKGEPMEVGAEVGTDLVLYTHLDKYKLADLLPLGSPGSEEQLQEMQDILADYHTKLKPIYNYYAAGGAMNNQEYWKLVKECKLADKTLFGHKFDVIFKEANRECDEDGNFKVSDGVEDDDDNPDTELVPIELMECLVRIANAKFKKLTTLTLSEKLDKLIVEQVLPNACQSDSGEFRNKLSEPLVSDVMTSYRTNLSKIFNSFSGADVSSNASANKTNSMNLKELSILLKKVGLMQKGFTMRDVTQIFQLVQDSGDDGGDDGGEGDDDDSELVFTEFLECIACISIFRDPNPYIPFYKRLGTFLEKDIDEPLRAALKLRKVTKLIASTASVRSSNKT